MSDAWAPLLVTGAAVAAAGLYLLTRSSKPLVFANPREERLTREVARIVACSLAQALPAVRRELDIAPSQPDETLAKRAAYHYRQELPATTCAVYRDKTRG